MARKTKEAEKLEDKNVEKTSKVKKNVESKSQKAITSSKKKTSTSKQKASTKNTSKKVTSKKSTLKKSTSKKSSSTEISKVSALKTKSTKKSTSKVEFSSEYYDLPYRYNQTIVKILSQTPKNLFVYWDISDNDRKKLEKKYGPHLFEITKPVLIVHNDTLDYSFEIDINDFANSWYINLKDANCEYRIELGRRPIPINYNYIQNYNGEEIHPIEKAYIYISSSNEIQSPNNKILFNLDSNIYFKNVKTNEVIVKDISNFLFISNIGKFYNLFDLYKYFYKDEQLLTKEFDFLSSSSGNPSSGSFSSKFK